ncbi:MAG: hypothetical protein HY763_13390 [Planctomycetes bacterium]|nr:hypothetical protein [Planctomycetota bacterium]
MILTLLFWLALFFPGYAVLRLALPDDARMEFPGVAAGAYFAAFALLSPVAIAGYLLHLPIAALSAACVAAVFAGAATITRRGWWGDLGRLFARTAPVGMLLVGADMVLGARVGGYLLGDAWVHVTRIRHLVDHGFNNQVPCVAGDYFFPIYHTNLLHALHAAGAVLTGQSALEAWYASLPIFKLLVAAGGYYLGHVVFGTRLAAWAVALFLAAYKSSTAYVLYPNQLAPLWLLAMMLAFAVQACRDRGGRRCVLKLAAGSLLLGEIHGLYVLFAGLAAGLPMAIAAAVGILRRGPGLWMLVGCLAALSAGAPFVLVSHYGRAGAEMAATVAASGAEKIIRADDGSLHYDPHRAVFDKGGAAALALLGAGCVYGLAGSRRRNLWPVVAATLATAAILLVPALCGAALRGVGREWIVARLNVLLLLAFTTLVVGSLAATVAERAGAWYWQVAVMLAAAVAGAVVDLRTAPTRAREYYASAFAIAEVRRSYIENTLELQRFCAAQLPRGATVLTDGAAASLLGMVYDGYVVLPGGGNTGVGDQVQRRDDLMAMLAPNTAWPRRRELLQRYGVRYYLVTRDMAPYTAWTQGRVARVVRAAGFTLLELRLDG